MKAIINKLVLLFIVCMIFFSVFTMVSCQTKDFEIFPEQSETDIYGEKNETTGLWEVKPVALPQAYNETVALKKTKKLKKGYYSASLSVLSESTNFDNNIHIVFGIYANGKVLALKEIYNNEFSEKNQLQNFRVVFYSKRLQGVTFYVYTTNRSGAAVDRISVKTASKKDYNNYSKKIEDINAEVFKAKKTEGFDSQALYIFNASKAAYSVYDTQTGYDVLLLVSALQGLVNRNNTYLFVIFDGKTDNYWLNYLKTERQIFNGRTRTVEISSVQDLLYTFKDFYKGFCLWDDAVPATENIACTVAGVEDVLPLRKNYALYNFLSVQNNFNIKKDLTGLFDGKGNIHGTDIESTGSAKNDAYLWAKENYLDKGLTNPTLMANHLDSFSFEKSGVFHSYYALDQCFLLNKDYYIANKAFFWDLTCLDNVAPNDDKGQPLGTDLKTLRQILQVQNTRANGKVTVIGGFVPWYIKYTSKAGYGNEGQVEPEEAEWAFARLFGEYYMIKDADAYGQTSLANASVYSKIERAPQSTVRPSLTDEQLFDLCVEQGYIDENGNVIDNNYICLYMGDYDSSAWIMKNMPAIINDKNLGFVPMCFPVNASIYERAGFIYNYMYDKFAENKNVRFIADHNGYGYLDIVSLDKAELLAGSVETYLQEAKNFNAAYGLTAQGFLIDTWGTTQEIFGHWETLLKPYSEVFPTGVSITTSAQMPFIDGCFGVRTQKAVVPWTKIVSFPNGSASSKQISVLLNEFKSIKGVNFSLLRTVVSTPTQLKNVLDDANGLGVNIIVLDYEIYYFLAEYHCIRTGNIIN